MERQSTAGGHRRYAGARCGAGRVQKPLILTATIPHPSRNLGFEWSVDMRYWQVELKVATTSELYRIRLRPLVPACTWLNQRKQCASAQPDKPCHFSRKCFDLSNVKNDPQAPTSAQVRFSSRKMIKNEYIDFGFYATVTENGLQVKMGYRSERLQPAGRVSSISLLQAAMPRPTSVPYSVLLPSGSGLAHRVDKAVLAALRVL